MTQVRVLSDTVINGHQVKCNRVADIDPKSVKLLEASGQVDSNKEAVAYALSENTEIIDCLQPPLGAEVVTDETEAATGENQGDFSGDPSKEADGNGGTG